MYKIVLALSCLSCLSLLSHGRRSRPALEGLETSHILERSKCIQTRRAGLCNPLNALAIFLLAFNPPSGTGPIQGHRPQKACVIPKVVVSMSDGVSPSVTVFGGSGFVGSRVCKALVEAGADVVSVSQSGSVPSWCNGERWTESVDWRANELTRGSREELLAAVGSPEVAVSCVGAVGFDVQGLRLGNGIANVEAAKAAKKAGAKSFVYVSVASELAESSSWLPGFFSGYFDGKRQAEATILEEFDSDGCTIVKPTFIYGGDSFGLTPPRVSSAYGSGVEELLSFKPIQILADIFPGLIKVALRPPVSVDSVAGACCAAALGKVSGVLDGTVAINKAAGQPAAKGLTDFINSIKDKISQGNAEKA